MDTIGHSLDNRVIGALKISDNPDLDEDEPVILFAGCHHGNEILSVEAPLVFIHYLVDNYGSDPEITSWVDSYEIWFIPLVNPDGRERLRRYNNNDVDLNRNYSFQFRPGGTHGPEPFSEPETRAVRDFAAEHPPVLSLTYHTSGRLLLYSWTHTDELAPDKPILTQIGGIVADSLNYTLQQGSGLTNVGLKFIRWLNVAPGDEARVRVNYNIVWESPANGIYDTQWQEQIIDISTFADNQPSVKIMFELQSNNDDAWAGGWNIDDFLVTGYLVSGVSEKRLEANRIEYCLYDNYPNPFNPGTKISYDIPKSQFVELKIFDVLGREIKSLVQEKQEAGFHQLLWDGKDEIGNSVASGLYFYKMKAGDF